jgi:sec-independent protein translocase protein TatB
MLDLGWTELLVIGVVALIVVGPKDLPVLFRNVGRYVGKAKGMAREFSQAMNQAADESGMNEISKGLKAASDPDSETGKLAAEKAKRVEQAKETAKKMQASSARAAAERKAREAQEALEKADEYEAALKADPPKSDT